jgi:magnesium transporter
MSSTAETPNYMAPLQERLAPVLNVLERLELIQAITIKQNGQSDSQAELDQKLSYRQYVAEVESQIDQLHPAEIADLLEMLPQMLRFFVWELISDDSAAEVLPEMQDSVVEDVLEETPTPRLKSIFSHVEAEELAELVDDLEDENLQNALQTAISKLAKKERDWVQKSRTYEEGSVGELMSMENLTFKESETVIQIIKSIQAMDELPDQCDKLFITDHEEHLLGEFPLVDLLRENGKSKISDVMSKDIVAFLDMGSAEEAVQSFEQYDLISAAVIDDRNKVIGRLTVESVMDFQIEKAEEQALARDGISGDVDLFGPIIEGAQQRWAWLAINLVTAFIASRCISLFEDTIANLVALATLMPIVASIGGNTGNQTIALIIRGLILGQITNTNLRFLIYKELSISLLNGVIWGSVLGGASWLLYQNSTLGLVMAGATTINLVLAAAFGITVPMLMHKAGKDPALGSSVILTFCTDSMGFFIFLGLATIFL